MAVHIFNDFRKEYWFHVSNQNEIPIFGHAEKSINANLLYTIAQQIHGAQNDIGTLKNIILQNVDSIDILRTIIGLTDKRMYLELSYIFNKYRLNADSDRNVLGESVYILEKHSIRYFKNKIANGGNDSIQVLDIIARYLENRGILFILHVLNKMTEDEISSLVDFLILPKEIQQEEAKRRGHGAEQALARLLFELGVSFLPDKRHENPMSQRDPNITKKDFKLTNRNEASTWSIDLVITQNEQLRVFVQGLIHSSDPGQYGVNKSSETVQVKTGLINHNAATHDSKELWGLVDGVGFIENPQNTIYKMLKKFDTFVQLKSLYKAGLRLHKLGLVKIKAIKFDMSFYTEEEASDMFNLYGSNDIQLIVDDTRFNGTPIQAGKAWLYI